MVTGWPPSGTGISVLDPFRTPFGWQDYLVIGFRFFSEGSCPSSGGLLSNLSPGLQSLIKNGMVVGILTVLLMEHVLLG